MNIPKRTHLSTARAFSLVELAMAIAIISFAMVGIVGLIPVGLNTYRDAMNLSIEAGVAQRLAAEVQRTDSANLTKLAGTNYYDDQGIETSEKDAIFFAQIEAPKSLEAQGIVTENSIARSVLISIANTRRAPKTQTTNTYSVIISEF